MAEQLADLIQGPARRGDVGRHRVPELVRVNRAGQACPPRQACQQLVERPRPHRRPERLAEQVDQQEVALPGLRAGTPFQHVLVVGLDDEPVGRDRPGPARLGCGAVGVVAAVDMQVLAPDPAAQPGGVRHEVHVLQPEPGQLAAPVPDPPQRQHDEPVPGVAAGLQQRQHVLVAGGVHDPGRLRQLVPGAAPQPQPGPVAAHLGGKVVVLHQVEQRIQHALVGESDRDGVPEELPDRGQHRVDPARAAHHPQLGAGRRVRVIMLHPVHEPAELVRRLPPVQPGRGAPVQEQRQRPGVRLGRALRAVPAQPDVQQPLIGLGHRPVRRIDHRPVPVTRRKPDPERPEPSHCLTHLSRRE